MGWDCGLTLMMKEHRILFINFEVLVSFTSNFDRVVKRSTSRKGYTKYSKIPILFTDALYEKLNIFRQKLNLKFSIYWPTFPRNEKNTYFY